MPLGCAFRCGRGVFSLRKTGCSGAWLQFFSLRRCPLAVCPRFHMVHLVMNAAGPAVHLVSTRTSSARGSLTTAYVALFLDCSTCVAARSLIVVRYILRRPMLHTSLRPPEHSRLGGIACRPRVPCAASRWASAFCCAPELVDALSQFGEVAASAAKQVASVVLDSATDWWSALNYSAQVRWLRLHCYLPQYAAVQNPAAGAGSYRVDVALSVNSAGGVHGSARLGATSGIPTRQAFAVRSAVGSHVSRL